MDLQDFRKEFLETIRSLAAAEKDFMTSSFVSVAAQKLAEAEEIEDFEFCYYEGVGRRNRRLQVDGYSFDTVDDTVSLLIADYHGDDSPETLSQTEAERLFDRLKAFTEEALSGTLHPVIEESSPGFGLAAELYRQQENVRKFRFLLISDCVLSNRIRGFSDGEIRGIPVEHHIWDISRFYRVFESSTGRDELEINFAEFSGLGIPCLEASQAGGEYKSYLCIIPGEILAKIYDQYGSRLLEGNVRSFLSTKGKVNKGIRSTILREPEMFFAYNNGIAATATDVEIVQTVSGLSLTRAASLQIVNGGQTTASLTNAKRKDGADLARIFVQMKLSVIGPEKAETVIPVISRCANSQNKVSEADFFSNHPFHIRMENISRRLWAPAVGGAQHETHWFYERARGQFFNDQAKMTAAERRRFLLQNPREQVVTKTDLAKYLNSWRGLPHTVSLGAQKNFRAFADWISSRWEQADTDFNEDFFRESVALAIIFRHTERLVTRQDWYQQGYRANIVAYTVASLNNSIQSLNREKLLDFRSIWNHQSVSSALDRQLAVISKDVFEIIVSPEMGYQNVTEWCKKERCWDRVKGFNLLLADELVNELINTREEKELHKNAKALQRTDNGIAAQIQVAEIGEDYWKKLRLWARERRLITSDEDSILNVAAMMSKGKIPTDRQSTKLLAIKNRLESEGFLA